MSGIDLRRCFTFGRWPQKSLADVGLAVRKFRSHLVSHQAFVTRTGLSEEAFEFAPWLDRRLGRLYDTRTTGSQHPRCRKIDPPPKHFPRPVVHPHAVNTLDDPPARRVPLPWSPYRWLRRVTAPGTPSARSDLTQSYWVAVADHTQASTHHWLTLDDVTRIERERSGLFRLKMEFLDLIATATVVRRTGQETASDRAAALRTGWMGAVDRELGPDEIKFYLRLDRLYRGVDVCGRYEQFPVSPSDPHAGGLSDLIDLAAEVEWELIEGGAQPPWDLLPREVQIALGDESGSEVRTEEVQGLLEEADNAWQRREEWLTLFRRQLVGAWAARHGPEVELFGLPDFAEQARFVQGWLTQVRRGASPDTMFTPVDRPCWDGIRHVLSYRGRSVKFNRTGDDGPTRVLVAFEAVGWLPSVTVRPSKEVMVTAANWRREKARWLARKTEGIGLMFAVTAAGIAWWPTTDIGKNKTPKNSRRKGPRRLPKK